MLRFNKSIVTTFGIAFVAFFLGGAGYFLTVKTLRTDPLEKYKASPEASLPETIAVKAIGTTFTRYEKGAPQAFCKVEEMIQANNKQVYQFNKISEGKVKWEQEEYFFQAEKGNWNGFKKELVIDGNAKLKGPKFDFGSQLLIYNEIKRSFQIPGPTQGNAYGGKLKVENALYDLKSKELKTGKGEWLGIPPAELVSFIGQDGKKQMREWNISAGESTSKGNLSNYTKVRMTDSEVIIIAPNASWNRVDDIVTATGRVRYFSGKANFIADKVMVYRKQGKVVLTGNVIMNVRPKSEETQKPMETEFVSIPSETPNSFSPLPADREARKKKEDLIRNSKNLKDFPLVISSSSIEYFYRKGKRKATILGKVQARQELPEKGWRYAWSNTGAIYDGEIEKLYLNSPTGVRGVFLRNSLGDELDAESLVLSTKEGDDEVSHKNATLKMKTFDDNDDESPPPPLT